MPKRAAAPWRHWIMPDKLERIRQNIRGLIRTTVLDAAFMPVLDRKASGAPFDAYGMLQSENSDQSILGVRRSHDDNFLTARLPN